MKNTQIKQLEEQLAEARGQFEAEHQLVLTCYDQMKLLRLERDTAKQDSEMFAGVGFKTTAELESLRAAHAATDALLVEAEEVLTNWGVVHNTPPLFPTKEEAHEHWQATFNANNATLAKIQQHRNATKGDV